jgi:hypothetical protein
MDRRSFLLFVSAAGLSACASKGPKATVQNSNIRSIGWLSLKEAPATGTMGPFNAALLGTVQPAKAVAPVNPTNFGVWLGLSLRAASDARALQERSRISAALQSVEFSPKDEVFKALSASFARRSLPIAYVTDDASSERARRDWDFSALPPGFDAVLDVTIDEFGYFYEKEAKGFSPEVYISASLVATANGGTRLERYAYQANYQASEGERGFITTDPSLTVPRLELVRGRAASINGGMRELVATIADRLSEDIDRSLKGLSALS